MKSLAKKYVELMSRAMSKQPYTRSSYYAWILKAGKSFEGSTKHVEMMRQKECFFNAQSLASSMYELEYYEGWGVTKTVGIPLEHGFNVNKDGNVIDATWDDGIDYFGVNIPREYIAKFWQKNKFAGSMLFDYFRDEIYEKEGD